MKITPARRSMLPFPWIRIFPISIPSSAGKDWSVVIWTTTPWTLPANLAIAFHPDYQYSAVRVGDKGYIVATELLKAVSEKFGWHESREVARFPGKSLEKRKARHPFIDRESLLVLGNYVTLDAGTGCVHTAPGHGYDDYVTGVNYGLDILCPVDDDGRFPEDVSHSEAFRFLRPIRRS